MRQFYNPVGATAHGFHKSQGTRQLVDAHAGAHDRIATVQRACRRAFTLVEMLIVMVIIGITFAVSLPNMNDSRDDKLVQAARLLAADIEYAQAESIAHPDDPRLVKLNTSTSTYWVAKASAPDAPITDVQGLPYLIAYGSGRAAGLSGVTITGYSLGGDAVLIFDGYGAPDQATAATVTLTCGASKTVQVAAGTGEVTVQ